MRDGYGSPEEAALLPTGQRRQVYGLPTYPWLAERAQLILETDQDHPYPYFVYCARHDGVWPEVVSGNARTYRWDDPDEYDW